MSRSFTRSSIKASPNFHSDRKIERSSPAKRMLLVGSVAIAIGLMMTAVAIPVLGQGEGGGRESIRMSVVVVNPSTTQSKIIPVKVGLPEEVTPDTILNSAGLTVEYDTQTSMYYLYKEDLVLQPKETRTFEVEVKDVWIVPQERLTALREQAQFVIGNLKGTEYYESAQKLGEAINKALDTIARTQSDETVSSRSHIGIYRNNLKIIDQIKEDIANLEREAPSSGAPPVPEVLENSQLKTKAPTKTTTWMIILIIMVFVGILAGVFFFTWQTQAHFTKDSISDARKTAFPPQGAKSPEGEKKPEKGGDKPKDE